jgi:hypothetical protein
MRLDQFQSQVLHPVNIKSTRISPEGRHAMVSEEQNGIHQKHGTKTSDGVPRFQSLQAGRGLAAIMVVLYQTEGIISLSKYWHSATRYFHFGASGVDFFFVLSGIVAFHAHRDDFGRPENLERLLLELSKKDLPHILGRSSLDSLLILHVYFVRKRIRKNAIRYRRISASDPDSTSGNHHPRRVDALSRGDVLSDFSAYCFGADNRRSRSRPTGVLEPKSDERQ